VADGLRPPDPSNDTAAASSTGGTGHGGGRSGGDWAAAALGVLALLGAGGWAWRLRRSAAPG
jgi:hypothetical protein